MRLFIGLITIFMIGCGSGVTPPLPLYSVTGTLKVDGKPLKEVQIQLVPVDMTTKVKPGIGMTDADGNFKIATNGDRGAAVAKYKVVLGQDEEGSNDGQRSMSDYSKRSGMYSKTGGPQKARKYPFPSEWTSPKTTPKTFDVEAKSNTLNLDI